MTARREVLAEGVEVWLGDCLEVLPTLGQFDVLVTDPPYGVNLGDHGAAKDGRANHVLVKGRYDSYDDTEENFVKIVAPAIEQSIAKTRRGLVFSASTSVWLLPRADLIGGVFLPAAQGRNRWGFTSFSTCLLYGQAPRLQYGSKPTAIVSTEAAEKNGHPCPKPLGWMKWAVSLASEVGDVLLDPFMGSGTTGVAAVKLGRKFTGIEIDPGYFEIAVRRISEALKQPDMFIAHPAPAKQEALLLDGTQ